LPYRADFIDTKSDTINMPTFESPISHLLPVFESLEERSLRLRNSNETLNDALANDLCHSSDVLDWLEYLAAPSEVPVSCEQIGSGFSFTLGPSEVNGRVWLGVVVDFDTNQRWESTTILNETLGRNITFVPQPDLGIDPAVAAALLGLQIHTSGPFRRPYWAAWHPSVEGEDQESRSRIEQRRQLVVQRMRNLLITRQVRAKALEGVAGQHHEEFQEALQSEVIMAALSSDWYPPSRSA